MHLPFIIIFATALSLHFCRAHLAFLLVYSAISVERGEQQNNRHGLQEVSW